MIKKLRLRFILVALASILLVLSATIASINIYNYVKIDQGTNNSLRLVIEQETREGPNDGMMPFNAPEDDGPFGPDHGEKNGDSLLREHYFIVSFNADGEIISSNFTHIFSVSQEDGESLAASLYNENKKQGKTNNLWYLQASQNDVTYYAFVDVKEKLDSFYNFLGTSVIVSLISYTILAGLIVAASFIVFKPSEESYRKQKTFITNASHELKTPLTIISTDLDIIEMDNVKNEWTTSIRDQVTRLTAMTNQLVILAKLDENNYQNYPFKEFDISKLADDCARSFAPTYAQNGFKFSFNIQEGVYFKGNRYLFNQLFYIFLDNALKYAKENDVISFNLKAHKKGLEIIFSNGVNEEDELDPNLLFERFYRGASAQKKEGSGIGLSIAKEIIDLHKGQVQVSINNGKISFVLLF